MAVETRGIVRMRGETTTGVEVEVLADGVRISLLHRDELIGDWEIGDIGIQSLSRPFARVWLHRRGIVVGIAVIASGSFGEPD